MKMPREPTDPHVIMLAALTRHMALDEEIRRMRDNADDYNRCHHAQGEFNRIRLALMDDPDFCGGAGWDKLIERCEDTAKTSLPRQR